MIGRLCSTAILGVFTAASGNAAVTLFSNTFEDGNMAAEVGTLTFNNAPVTMVVPVSSSPDPTLGTSVGLIDLESPQTNPLDMDIAFPTTPLSGSTSTVVLSFDVAARRTNGFAKTTYIQGLDSGGNPIMEFVLGDTNAFGNGAADRQRPGWADSSGNTALGDDFYWGADSNSTDFNVIRDAHFDIAIRSDGWAINGVRQTGVNDIMFPSLPTYTGGTFADIASFKVTSQGSGYGLYWDNITVIGIPEPSRVVLLGLGALGFIARRRR